MRTVLTKNSTLRLTLILNRIFKCEQVHVQRNCQAQDTVEHCVRLMGVPVGGVILRKAVRHIWLIDERWVLQESESWDRRGLSAHVYEEWDSKPCQIHTVTVTTADCTAYKFTDFCVFVYCDLLDSYSGNEQVSGTPLPPTPVAVSSDLSATRTLFRWTLINSVYIHNSIETIGSWDITLRKISKGQRRWMHRQPKKKINKLATI